MAGTSPVKITLRAKIILLSCSFAAAAAAAIIALNFYSVAKVERQSLHDALSSETQAIAIRLEENFVKMVEDARVLSLTPPITGIARSLANDGLDPLDGSSDELWRVRLATIMTSLLEVRPNYTQVRYIGLDGNGMELVRVNRVGNKIQAVAQDKLQAKGPEPYMQMVPKIKPGEAWFSPVSLNREFGEVEESPVHTIRLVFPVFDQDGSKFGALVINADYEALLSETLKRASPSQDTIVLTTRGDMLVFDAARGSASFHYAEEASDAFLLNQIGLNRPIAGVLKIEDRVVFDYPVRPVPGATGLEIDILMAMPLSVLNTAGSISGTALFSLFLLLASVAIAAIAADRMTQPLRQMAERIKLTSEFGSNVEMLLPMESTDEIGGVARAFNALAEKLKNSQSLTSNIVSNSVYGLIVIDHQGNISTFNPAAEEMFGYAASDVIGKNVAMLMDTDHAENHDHYLKSSSALDASRIIGRGRELKARRKSGELFNIEISVSEILQDGQTFYCGFLRDMTHAVSQRRELQQQKNTLELALDGGELGLWDWDIETDQFLFSERWATMLGYEKSELKEEFSTWQNLLEPEDLNRTVKLLQQFMGGSIPKYEVEFRMKHKAGHWVWIQSKGKVFELDDRGEPSRIVGIHLDISERKAQELAIVEQNRELEQAKKTLEFALDGGELGFWTWDLATDHVDFCERSSSLVGLTRDEMANDHSTWQMLVDPEQRVQVQKAMADFITGKANRFTEEFRMRHASGKWVWVQSHAIITERDERGRVVKITGIQQDVTSRKEKELEVVEQNRKLELAETVADMGHWYIDGDTQSVYWSEGIYKIHGVDPKSYKPDLQSGIEFYHPEDQETVNNAVEHALKTGKPFDFQLHIIRPNGEIRHVLSKGEVEFTDNLSGAPNVFGIFQDVTEKVLSEERLKESEEKNRLLLSNMVDGVVTFDEDGIIDDCNAACASIFGYEVNELIGASVSKFVPENFQSSHKVGMRLLRLSVESSVLGQTVEARGVKQSGDEMDLELAISAVNFGGKKFYTCILRDITERKQIAKMKDEFVSTVNHELRTPLTSIYGSLDILQTLLAGQLDEDSEELLQLAHDGCGRLSNLVNDILDLEKIAAGKMEYRREIVSLSSMVDDIVRRHQGLETQFGISFNIRHELTDETVQVDPSRFNQALVNLLSNAAKFSPKGDVVEVLTKHRADGGFRVSVVDHGPGIPEDFQARIFEKFAQADGSSTRSTPGTGLGLNITKSIMEAFNGSISFDTEIGKGTVFHLDLPAISSDLDDKPDAQELAS